jgi:hypothetical protein
VVPNEPDMFEKYEAKHWQHRGSDLVFKAPNWDNLEWRAHSRALFWEMVHSIRSVRGRTMPLRVDGLYYTPLRVLIPSSGRIFSSPRLRFDSSMILAQASTSVSWRDTHRCSATKDP